MQESRPPDYDLESQRRYLEDLLATPDMFTEENMGNISPLQEAVLTKATIKLRRSGSMVLDAGCGNGKMTWFLERFTSDEEDEEMPKVVPLDVSSKTMKLIANTFFLSGVVGDLRFLPFKPESFSGVLLAQVLEFVPVRWREVLLQEVMRVLSPNGLLVVVSMNRIWQEEDVLDMTRQHETVMLREPVKQTDIVGMVSKHNGNLVGMETFNVYRNNDFFMVEFKKGVSNEEEPEEEEPVYERERKKRTSIWE